jgi:hypothetical protein
MNPFEALLQRDKTFKISPGEFILVLLSWLVKYELQLDYTRYRNNFFNVNLEAYQEIIFKIGVASQLVFW